MDVRTRLRRRVGDTPLQKAPRLAKEVGLPNLRLKMEGANPTGTQKDRIAHLEVGEAVGRGAPGVTVASCGNFGVAVAHAAYLHDIPCHVFVPEDFTGERVALMQDMNAIVHRVPGTYEDAVESSREHSAGAGLYDANPGGASTLRTMAGYARIATEILDRVADVPVAIGLPIGNGSTLAGVHLGFRTAWAQGKVSGVPRIFGGSSAGNNPVPPSFAGNTQRCEDLDAATLHETDVNEPLVNWHALDGTACLTAIQDSRGGAYGFDDDTLLRLHDALAKDGIDAHPASLAAVAALEAARKDGDLDADAPVVAVLTSGRPQLIVEEIPTPDDMHAFLGTLSQWLGRFGDPEVEMDEAVRHAFKQGRVLVASDDAGPCGYAVLTPMQLDTFFPRYHLSYIAVDPRARGRGVGTVLLEEAIRVTDGDLSLHVETDNAPALRLYEKFGFNKKYFRMLYKGGRTPEVDPAQGAGWNQRTDGAGRHARANAPEGRAR